MAVEPEFAEQVAELRKRVVRADRALICCRSAESRQQLDILRTINEVIGAIANAQTDSDLALVPAPAIGVGLQTRLVWVKAGGPLALGAVVLASGVQLGAWAQTLGALDALSFLSTALGQVLSTRKGGCYDCLKKNILSQSAPRKREKAKILRRV